MVGSFGFFIGVKGVKCWNQTQEDKGYVKEGLVINSDRFLRHQARGMPTPDLVVLEFQG